MRALACAAAAAFGILASSVAAADPWTDPAGRLTFTAPSGWRVQQRANPDQTIVLAFNAANDCYIFSLPNAATAAASPNAVRNSTTQIPAEAWATAAGTIRDFFPDGVAHVVSQSVDTSGFWPVQRAELHGASKTVFGVMQARPGFEIRALCSGAADAATYDGLFASLAHPNDAAWRAQAEQQAAERAAQQAAPQAPPEPEQNNRRRRNN